MIVHAGCVARRLNGGWRGVLITGPSGAGKSDLALRLMERGWALVADDRVRLWTSGGALWGRAPDTLHGRLEARGVGVGREPATLLARLMLNAHCEPPAERVPDPGVESLLGIGLPTVRLAPLEASAPAKIERALSQVMAGGFYRAALARI